MNEHLLELRDHGLRLSNREGVLDAPPGFASVTDDAVLYGTAAKDQYRLHPRVSYNQFWGQLSLEPLRNPSPHFRHYADIAFGQLSTLTTEQAPDSHVVFALPSHYNRDQMAVLLGLVEHCPVTPVGMVDQAVLAAACTQHQREGIYLELQLHQAVLTWLQLEEGHITRTRVQQIPGAGLLALFDGWANMITDAFIKQCRFNPLHVALTEQFVYDNLESWMTSALEQNEVQLDINHKGTLYQATVLRTHFEQKSRSLFTRIAQELGNTEQVQLMLPESVHALPGCQLWLPDHESVNPQAMHEHAFELMPFIHEHSQGHLFLTMLPGGKIQTPVAPPIPRNRHLLIGHRTFALPAGGSVEPGVTLAADAGLPEPFVLECGLSLTLGACPETLLLNGEPASTGQTVKPGDRLGFADSEVSIQVIEVG